MSDNRYFTIILVIFILLSCGLGGYIVYDKFFAPQDVCENNVDSTDTDTDDEVVSLKAVPSMPWIYKAVYAKKPSATKYSTEYKTYYAKDIRVPYFNISSVDAKNVNDKIKAVYDLAVENFNKGVNDRVSFVNVCDFTRYYDDQIVSSLLEFGVNNSDTQYYPFTLNVLTGKLVTFKEAYNYVGILESDLESLVMEAIEERQEEIYSKDSSYPSGTTFETYYEESLSNYHLSLDGNSLQFYIDEDKELNIIVRFAIPVGNGSRLSPVTISKN